MKVLVDPLNQQDAPTPTPILHPHTMLGWGKLVS